MYTTILMLFSSVLLAPGGDVWFDVVPRSRPGACSAFGYRLRSLLSAYHAPLSG